MYEKAMRTILSFLNFDKRSILELEYFIEQAEIYNIIDEVKRYLNEFSPSKNESMSTFYKKAFLNEFAWRFCELVCGEFYPEVAISKLVDFCSYHQNIWLDNEENNPYYKWFLKNDLRTMTIQEAIKKNYLDNKEYYDKYFQDETLVCF